MMGTIRSNTDLEVAWHCVAAPSRPHDLDELRVARRDLAVHAKWIVTVQLILPLVCHEVLSQCAHVAQALEGKGLTLTQGWQHGVYFPFITYAHSICCIQHRGAVTIMKLAHKIMTEHFNCFKTE